LCCSCLSVPLKFFGVLFRVPPLPFLFLLFPQHGEFVYTTFARHSTFQFLSFNCVPSRHCLTCCTPRSPAPCKAVPCDRSSGISPREFITRVLVQRLSRVQTKLLCPTSTAWGPFVVMVLHPGPLTFGYFRPLSSPRNSCFRFFPPSFHPSHYR